MGNAFNFTHTSELATEELRESLNILKIIMSQQASENNLQYKINLHEKIILNLWKHIDNNKDKMNESQILDPLESIETHLHESQASLLQISSITRWHSDDIIYLTNSIKEIISSQNKELAAIKKMDPARELLLRSRIKDIENIMRLDPENILWFAKMLFAYEEINKILCENNNIVELKENENIMSIIRQHLSEKSIATQEYRSIRGASACIFSH